MPSGGLLYPSRRIPNPLEYHPGGSSGTCLNCTQPMARHFGQPDGRLRCPAEFDPPKWCRCRYLRDCTHDYCAHCGARILGGLHWTDGTPSGRECQRPKDSQRGGPNDLCTAASCRVPLSAHCARVLAQHGGGHD